MIFDYLYLLYFFFYKLCEIFYEKYGIWLYYDKKKKIMYNVYGIFVFFFEYLDLVFGSDRVRGDVSDDVADVVINMEKRVLIIIDMEKVKITNR